MSTSTKHATLTYYTYPLAYYPAKVSLMLAEKRLPFKRVFVDLMNGQSLEPWYIKINPSASVPSLQITTDEGTKTITQSAEIIELLDASGQFGPPLGGPGVDREDVVAFAKEIQEWDGNIFAANVVPGPAKGLLKALGNYRSKFAEARMKQNPDLAQTYKEKVESIKKMSERDSDPQVGQANLQQLHTLLDKAEARLSAGKPFLCGDSYTVADVVFTPILYRVADLGQYKKEIEPRPAVRAYLKRMRERESWKQVYTPTESGLAKASWILPAIIKANVAWLTRRY